MKAQSKELMGVTLQSSMENAVCGKMGHHAKNWHKRQDQGTKKGSQANITEVENLSKDVDDIDLSAVISEVNLVAKMAKWP